MSPRAGGKRPPAKTRAGAKKREPRATRDRHPSLRRKPASGARAAAAPAEGVEIPRDADDAEVLAGGRTVKL
ncbi:MAG TPA: hypothetical protein VIZ58_02115, partial [Thermoanaerobaculia bacterium]